MRFPSLLAFALATSVGLCAAPSFGGPKDKPVDKKPAAGLKQLKGEQAGDKKVARKAGRAASKKQLVERVGRLENELASLRKEVASLRQKGGGGEAKEKFQKPVDKFAKPAKDGFHPEKAAKEKGRGGGDGDENHVKKPEKAPDAKPFKKDEKSPDAKHFKTPEGKQEALKGKADFKEAKVKGNEGASAHDEKDFKQKPGAEKFQGKEGGVKGKESQQKVEKEKKAGSSEKPEKPDGKDGKKKGDGN